MYQSINPANGECLATYPLHDEAEVEAALQLSQRTSRIWSRSSVAERSAVLLRLAELMEREKADHARTLTLEMGKTYRSAIAEVEKCASACRWYAEHGPGMLEPEEIDLPAAKANVHYLPIGTVFAIMPWNFAFWQVIRFLAPALMAGNAAILKHAPSTPGAALALTDLAKRAGLEEGVFQSLFLDNEQAARVIADSRVHAVTLTGSERAGEAVGAAAGRALKRAVLELGGSDPLIVMPDADVEAALKAAIFGRNQNNGQSCVCAKRILVHDSLYAHFREALVRATEELVVGDPMNQATDVGPLASFQARENIARQVERAITEGGRLLTGGTIPEGEGAYYLPTVIEALPAGASIRKEELFGPVALLFSFASVGEAIEIANETPFGLGSSVWTSNAEAQAAFADGLEVGMTFFNAVTASDPRIPFGGIKRSGFGRELGRWGMHEFVNVRTIVRA